MVQGRLTGGLVLLSFSRTAVHVIRIYDQQAIAHNKVILIDRQVVITDSFNVTKAAENNNAENLLVIRDKRLAEWYL